MNSEKGTDKRRMTLVSSRGKNGCENDPNTNLKDRDHIVCNRGYMNTHEIQGGYMNTHEIQGIL